MTTAHPSLTDRQPDPATWGPFFPDVFSLLGGLEDAGLPEPSEIEICRTKLLGQSVKLAYFPADNQGVYEAWTGFGLTETRRWHDISPYCGRTATLSATLSGRLSDALTIEVRVSRILHPSEVLTHFEADYGPRDTWNREITDGYKESVGTTERYAGGPRW